MAWSPSASRHSGVQPSGSEPVSPLRVRPASASRSQHSIWQGRGNFGAPRPPPYSGSQVARQRDNPSARCASTCCCTASPSDPAMSTSVSPAGPSCEASSMAPTASTSCAAYASTFSGSSFHTSSTAFRPASHCALGKYVPPQIGRPSGSATQFSGQPPRRVISCTASMYTWSTSGRSSRSTLMLTKWAFMNAAASSSSNVSCSITWHQWQAL